MNVKERIIDFARDHRRPVALLPAAVIVGVALGLLASPADNEADQTRVSGQIDGNNAASEIYLPGGMPSEQALKEQVTEPIFLPDVFALMKNTGDPKLVAAAEKLGNLYAYRYIEVVDELLPEETNLQAERGRFPGSLVQWNWEQRPGLTIAIPKEWLEDPGNGEAEIAYLLLANLKFARNLERRNLTAEGVQVALVEAEKEALGAMGPMASQVKNPLLWHNIAQYRAATQYPAEVTK